MNNELLSRICDSAGRLTSYVQVVPRGSYFSPRTLKDALKDAVPEVDWYEVGNAYEKWVNGEVPETMTADSIVRRITEAFKANGTWDEIEDPEVVDPEEDW